MIIRMEYAVLGAAQYARAKKYLPADSQLQGLDYQQAMDWQRGRAGDETVHHHPLMSGELQLTVSAASITLGLQHEDLDGDWSPVMPGEQHLTVAYDIVGDEGWASAQFSQFSPEEGRYWEAVAAPATPVKRGKTMFRVSHARMADFYLSPEEFFGLDFERVAVTSRDSYNAALLVGVAGSPTAVEFSHSASFDGPSSHFGRGTALLEGYTPKGGWGVGHMPLSGLQDDLPTYFIFDGWLVTPVVGTSEKSSLPPSIGAALAASLNALAAEWQAAKSDPTLGRGFVRHHQAAFLLESVAADIQHDVEEAAFTAFKQEVKAQIEESGVLAPFCDVHHVTSYSNTVPLDGPPISTKLSRYLIHQVMGLAPSDFDPTSIFNPRRGAAKSNNPTDYMRDWFIEFCLNWSGSYTDAPEYAAIIAAATRKGRELATLMVAEELAAAAARRDETIATVAYNEAYYGLHPQSAENAEGGGRYEKSYCRAVNYPYYEGLGEWDGIEGIDAARAAALAKVEAEQYGHPDLAEAVIRYTASEFGYGSTPLQESLSFDPRFTRVRVEALGADLQAAIEAAREAASARAQAAIVWLAENAGINIG